MPFSSPDQRLRALERDLRGLGRPTGFGQRMVLQGIRRAVAGILKEEFQSSKGPDGPWKPTVRGEPALRSKKLPGAFKLSIGAGRVIGLGKSTRDMLEAHQLGHVFPARRRGSNEQFLTFNRKGRLIKNSRALNKKGEAKRGVYQTFARAHTVGRRVLPARPLVPTGTTLPPLWSQRIAAGAQDGLSRWAQKIAR